MDSTLLLIFIIINGLAIGAVAVVGLRHAHAHFRQEKPEPAHSKPQAQTLKLAPDVKERILAAAAVKYEKILDRSADELQKDMSSTSDMLSKKLDKLAEGIIEKELERYRNSLEEIRINTAHELSAAKADIETHQQDLQKKLAEREAELRAQMDTELAAEKQQLIDQIDSRLADAVASFLLENLGHNVDLGAQTAYLTQLLEEHKEDFKKEVADGAHPSK